MSNTADSPSREIYLLENVPIQGRKTELRQLLKLLNLAKTGQPKAALITGDAGIGKTALLDTFTQLVTEGVYCRVLRLGKMNMHSPEAVYVSIIEKLQAEADSILDDALVAVNEITRELDLHWDRHDLVRAIALVKLQESIGGKEAVSQEQLVKAIRSQVSAVKKLKFSVNESIQKLVDLIVNPWVMIATSLLNPISPALQEAIKLAETLRENNFTLPQEEKLVNLLNLNEHRAAASVPVEQAPPPVVREQMPPPVIREPLPPLGDIDYNPADFDTPPSGISSSGYSQSTSQSSAKSQPVKKLPMLVDSELNMIFDENNRTSMDSNLMPSGGTTSPRTTMTSASSASRESGGSDMGYTPVRLDAPARPIKDPLLRHLMTVFNFVNGSIQNMDSGLLIVLDEWDRIQDVPKLAELKEFLSELVLQVTEQKNYHFMIVMTARTEGESYTLGGTLYNHFRTKLLLDVLHESACRKLARSEFKSTSAELDEEIHLKLFRLSRGNPFWHLKMVSYLKERVESNNIRQVDGEFFDKLGIDQLSNLFELSFTRLKLTFLNDEESLYKVMAALLKHFDEQSFSANQAIKEISASQGFTDGYVFEVLRALYRHDFIRLAGPTEIGNNASEGNNSRDPVYIIQSRFILEFLREKTHLIETSISTDEKIMFLKKIIPLSVKSGDLDREKTMEVLALGDAMGNSELVTFLEEVFIEAMQDPRAAVRVTALNNIALLETSGARQAIFNALGDNDSMVREYAARNLAMLTQKAHDASLASQVVEMMLEAIDDESEAVRDQVYSALSKHRAHRDLTSVFLKGSSDACNAVRITSIRNLTELDVQTPYVFNCLMDAMKDPVSEVRRYACLGLQQYLNPEAIDAIVNMLQTDADTGLRSLAADSLSRMEDNKAFVALVNALRQDASEDVKLAVVRALGRRRGWQTEAVLQEALQNADYEQMPAFTWACIRSLGNVGGTERSRSLLMGIKKRIGNSIILSALDMAIKRINERIEELHQMERQLEEATPVTVATPSEYDQEVDVPEEEVIDEAALQDATRIQDGDMIDEAEAEARRQASAMGGYEFMEKLPAYKKAPEQPISNEPEPGRSHSILKLPFARR